MSGILTSNGLAIRLLFTRLFGTRVHGFDGDNELVINPGSLEILRGEAADSVKEAALRRLELHKHEIQLMGRKVGVAA
jgi:hypothetical protein